MFGRMISTTAMALALGGFATFATADSMATDPRADFNYQTMVDGMTRDAMRESGRMLEVVDERATIETMLLTDVEGTEPAGGIGTRIDERAEDIAYLRNVIGENPALTAALADDGYTPEDVVAVNLPADGEVVMVVDDRG